MKFFTIILAMGISASLSAQELFIYSEPASNMPAKIPAVRINYFREPVNKGYQRVSSEIMYGFSPKLMLHAGTSFSDMYSSSFRNEGAFVYAKYRFLSHDDVHKHFRMAAFGEASYSRNPYRYDEINLQGDRSGLQLGLSATQLLNKIAVSGSLSHTQTFGNQRNKDIPGNIYSSFNYTFSGGLLILPVAYKSYQQLNLNFYLEVLGQQSLEARKHYLDLAPAFQLIFNSNTRLNLGYRFQVNGNMNRGMERSVLVGVEHSFYGRRKKS